MGFFDFLRKPKTDVELYYEEWEKQALAHPTSANATEFYLVIEDVFSVSGRGVVVVGKVSAGTLCVGERVMLHHKDGTVHSVRVKGLELFRKTTHKITAGNNAGILLADISKGDVSAGDILCGSDKL